jgi:hypothetical protein
MPPKSDDPRPHDDAHEPDDDEETLDEELEESFPSSDPPGTGGPGV